MVAVNLNLNDDPTVHPLALARFFDLTSEWSEMRCGSADDAVPDWGAMCAAIVKLGGELSINIEGRYSVAVFKLPTSAGDAAALVSSWTRWQDYHVDCAGASNAAADEALTKILSVLPSQEHATDDTVEMSFWMFDPMQGGTYRTRRIDRLNWDAVAVNYPASIRPALEALNSITGPPDGGRLMVFHGPPGTGKTRYLQSLAASWASWCDFHYIVDPDEMFSTARYLNSVILDGYAQDDRWRLIVIEDGDEFIDTNAKARTGHGVSRLLNVADGLIGQGLRVMALISTNVEAPKFLPAVTRAGRCGAEIEFPAFSKDEATDWAAAHELGLAFDGDVTLADLYQFLPRPA